MPVMKISPIFQNLSYRKNNNKNNTVHILNNVSKDSVSFGAAKNIVQVNLEELDEVIEKDVIPAMQKSKDFWIAIGKIGYNAQETLKVFSEEEKSLMFHKLKLQDKGNNEIVKKYRRYINCAYDYNDNFRQLKSLKKMAELPIYAKPEILESISSAEKLYTPTIQTDSILALEKSFDMAYETLSNKLDRINLSNTNIELYKRRENLKEQLSEAQYFMLVSPYGDSAKIIEKRNEIKKNINSNNVPLYDALKDIENLRLKADKIAESAEFFNQNIKDMNTFIQQNEKNPLSLNSDDIKSEYSKIKNNCNIIFDNMVKELETNCEKHYANLDEIVNIAKIYRLIKKQKEANIRIQNKINKIKQDYITKQNEEFMKNNGE